MITFELTQRDADAIVRVLEKQRRGWHPDPWVKSEDIRLKLREAIEEAEHRDCVDYDVYAELQHDVDEMERNNEDLLRQVDEMRAAYDILRSAKDEMEMSFRRFVEGVVVDEIEDTTTRTRLLTRLAAL